MLRNMRIELEIDDDLLEHARAHAASLGTSVDAVVESALRVAVTARAEGRGPVMLPTHDGGGGLRPGVNLDGNAALLDLLEPPEETRRRPFGESRI